MAYIISYFAHGWCDAEIVGAREYIYLLLHNPIRYQKCLCLVFFWIMFTSLRTLNIENILINILIHSSIICDEVRGSVPFVQF